MVIDFVVYIINAQNIIEFRLKHEKTDGSTFDNIDKPIIKIDQHGVFHLFEIKQYTAAVFR